jgi:hypothetical protein
MAALAIAAMTNFMLGSPLFVGSVPADNVRDLQMVALVI